VCGIVTGMVDGITLSVWIIHAFLERPQRARNAAASAAVGLWGYPVHAHKPLVTCCEGKPLRW